MHIIYEQKHKQIQPAIGCWPAQLMKAEDQMLPFWTFYNCKEYTWIQVRHERLDNEIFFNINMWKVHWMHSKGSTIIIQNHRSQMSHKKKKYKCLIWKVGCLEYYANDNHNLSHMYRFSWKDSKRLKRIIIDNMPHQSSENEIQIW